MDQDKIGLNKAISKADAKKVFLVLNQYRNKHGELPALVNNPDLPLKFQKYIIPKISEAKVRFHANIIVGLLALSGANNTINQHNSMHLNPSYFLDCQEMLKNLIALRTPVDHAEFKNIFGNDFENLLSFIIERDIWKKHHTPFPLNIFTSLFNKRHNLSTQIIRLLCNNNFLVAQLLKLPENYNHQEMKNVLEQYPLTEIALWCLYVSKYHTIKLHGKNIETHVYEHFIRSNHDGRFIEWANNLKRSIAHFKTGDQKSLKKISFIQYFLREAQEKLPVSEEWLNELLFLIKNSEKFELACFTVYQIALMLQKELIGNSADKNKISAWLKQIDTAGILFYPNLKPHLFTKSEIPFQYPHSYYWNSAIKIFLLASNAFFEKSKLNEMSSSKQFVDITISFIDVILPHYIEIEHVSSFFLKFFKKFDCESSIFLIGSMAQECLSQALMVEENFISNHDIDLSIIIKDPKDNLFLMLKQLENFLNTQTEIKMLYNNVAMNENYLASFSFLCKEKFFDVAIYNRHLPSIDSLKSFLIDVKTLQVYASRENLILLLQGLRSFDSKAFQSPGSLAYIFRELAKMKHQKVTLTEASSAELNYFINHPENYETISRAIGILMTKYLTSIDSIIYPFLMHNELLAFIKPMSLLHNDSEAMSFIAQASLYVMSAFSPNKNDNIFPVVFLALAHCLCNFTLIEPREKLFFPERVCARLNKVLFHFNNPYSVDETGLSQKIIEAYQTHSLWTWNCLQNGNTYAGSNQVNKSATKRIKSSTNRREPNFGY